MSEVVASSNLMVIPMNCSVHKTKIIRFKFNFSYNLISSYFMVLSNHNQRSVNSKNACPRLEGAEATAVGVGVHV